VSIRKPNWAVVSRIARGVFALAILALLAPDVWRGAIGVKRPGMDAATITRAEHPIVFWALAACIVGLSLHILYIPTFRRNPDQ